MDPHGIIHLTEEDFYYREVARSFFDGMMDADDVEGFRRAFVAAVEGLPSDRRDHLLHYALNPNRGGAAILGDIGAGTRTLDFGSGWGNLTAVAARAGGEVVSVDMTFESLLFSRMSLPDNLRSRSLHVRAGRHDRLPFLDNAFDTVCLNGVLEWLPEGFMLDSPPQDVQRRFLVEFQRILKPGGRLIIGIENRHSGLYFLGQREDHTRLRFGAILPRRVADRYSRMLRGRPYRTFTYTAGGYRRLLRGSGFASAEFFVPWLRYRRWDKLVDHRNLRRVGLFGNSEAGIKRRIARVTARLAQRTGVLFHFVPDYYIVATKSGHSIQTDFTELQRSTRRKVRRSLVEHVVAAADVLPPSHVPTIVSRSSHALHLCTGDIFFQIPLSDLAERRLRDDVSTQQRLSHTQVAPFLVPRAEMRTTCGLAHAVFTRIDHRVPDRGMAVPLSDEFRAAIHGGHAAEPLGETDLLRRLRLRVEQNMWPDWMSGEVVARLLDHVSQTSVQAGWVHGDLTPQNMLHDAGGRLYIIDWDRFEERSPAFLDLFHYAVRDEHRTTGRPLDQCLARFLQGRHDDRDGSDPLLGDLEIGDAVALYALDRMDKELEGVETPSFCPSAWHQAWAANLAAALPPAVRSVLPEEEVR